MVFCVGLATRACSKSYLLVHLMGRDVGCVGCGLIFSNDTLTRVYFVIVGYLRAYCFVTSWLRSITCAYILSPLLGYIMLHSGTRAPTSLLPLG